MAPPPIIPWLGKLIDSELENIIAWKSIVKPEPDADEETISSSRFKETDSNLRSVVGSPPLDANSKLQLLEAAGQNARHPLPVSDGETTLLVRLADAAWKAYKKGLKAIDDEEEPAMGDLIVCTRITVISTSDGPENKRVQLRIEDLEFPGDNVRDPIGKPVPVQQRESVVDSLKKIARIRAKQSEIDAMDEEEDDDEDDADEDAEYPDDVERTDDIEHADPMEEEVPSLRKPVEQADAGARLDTTTLLESPIREPEPDLPTSPRDQNSPNLSKSTTDAQIETQLPVGSIQTQSSQQPRDPVRRSRGGGYSMGREGFEVARGDNLTGPQAPMLPHRRSLTSEEPPRNHLLDVLTKKPGEAQRQRSPEPSAPVSAQAVREEIVVETPITTKRLVVSTAPAPTSSLWRRKRHRILDDQRRLLGDLSSWLPPAAGREFPHPNVPIDRLQAWNAKAMSKPLSQSSPLPADDPGTKSVEEVQPYPRSEPPEDSEGRSDEDSMSSSAPLSNWTPTPPPQTELPPDSSAIQSSARASRPVSRDSTGSVREITAATSSKRASGVSTDTRRWNPQSSSQQPMSQSREDVPHISQTPYPDRRGRDSYDARSTPASRSPVNITMTERKNGIRSRSRSISRESSRPRHIPGLPHGLQDSSLGSSADACAVRKTGESLSQIAPPAFGAANNTPATTDNYQGSARPPTQRLPNSRPGEASERAGRHPGSNISINSSAPIGAPTGPRFPNGGPRSSQFDRKRQSSGNFYRSYGPPSNSNRQSLGSQPVSHQLPGNTQPPNGTSEMEVAVPRAMKPMHDARSAWFKDQQRRHWLTNNLPSGDKIVVSPSLTWKAYLKAHPKDEVSQEAFEKLVEEYRPDPPLNASSQQCENSIKPAMRPTDISLKRKSRVSSITGRSSTINGNREARREREAMLHDQPSQPGIFTEFVEAWRNVMPGQSAANDTARHRLDVLSWGFGE